MVEINELLKNDTKKLELSNGIEVDVKMTMSIQDQQEIIAKYYGKQNETEMAVELSFGLIKSRNITDNGQPVELDLGVFKSLPLNFEDINKIISESGILKMSMDSKKKNIGEI